MLDSISKISTNQECLQLWQKINQKKRETVPNEILNNVLEDLKSKIVRKIEQGNTETKEYNLLQANTIDISIWILENDLSELLRVTTGVETPDKMKLEEIEALREQILELENDRTKIAIEQKKMAAFMETPRGREVAQAAEATTAATPDQQKTQTQPISKTQKILTDRVIALVFGLILLSASQIGLAQTMIFASPIAAVISFGLIAREIINNKDYSKPKKAALISSYCIAHAAAWVLFMDIYAYAVPILVLSALIAIAAQLYYKENTPSHFRQFCLNMSILFFISTLDPINILALLSSSLWLHSDYAAIIMYVILNYDYLVSNSSTGEYIADNQDLGNITMPFIEFHANYVFFFLGLISRNPNFPEKLKKIKWQNLILGIIIGAVALWINAILTSLVLGNMFVACIGALPNAFSMVSVLILTPFQAYYEEYFFRHKLTEKIQSIYALFIESIWNKYLSNKYAAEPKLATNSYLVYSITSVFFALAHIASPGRNFSVLLSLLTTLPMGILFHKIYSDYGIEASTGVHAGHNSLIWLNMLPIFITATAPISIINICLAAGIILCGEAIITVILSKAFLAPVAQAKTAPTESSAFSNMCKQVQGYCNSAKSTLSSYAEPILGCL